MKGFHYLKKVVYQLDKRLLNDKIILITFGINVSWREFYYESNFTFDYNMSYNFV